MAMAVGALIAALKEAVSLQVRSTPAPEEYLEGVLGRQDLARCHDLLRGALGPAVKAFSQAVTFDAKTSRIVKTLGGIRADQCLFLSPVDAQAVVYAALWPWASDPSRVTLKVGVVKMER